MTATRSLIGQGMVDGLSPVRNSGHAIRGERGRFVSKNEARRRASTPGQGNAATLQTRDAEMQLAETFQRSATQLDNVSRVQPRTRAQKVVDATRWILQFFEDIDKAAGGG